MPTRFNDALDDIPIPERCEAFSGGMDGFNRPALIGPLQAQSLVNMLVEDNGTAVTRQGALSLDTVPTGGARPPLSTEISPVDAARIRAIVYSDFPVNQVGDGHREFLYAANGANIYALARDGWIDVSVDTPVVTFAVGGNWVYGLGPSGWYRTNASDNSNTWTELGDISGTNASDPPVGALLACWHTFRMFASGDPNFPDTIWASNIGDAGPGAWNHPQFSFRVGSGEGDDITAICPLTGFWLFVGKAGSIWAVNADPTLAQTGDGAAGWPIKLQARGVGCVGPKAAVQFGNDVLFMARDGIRSVQRSAAVSDQFDVTPPLSQPVHSYIKRVNWNACRTIAAHAYRQFALFAIPIDGATQPNCVLVWNGRTQAWAGAWTGWTPTCWATTRFGDSSNGTLEKLVFGDTLGAIKAWQDYGIEAAGTYQDDDVEVSAQLITRGMVFGDPSADKTLRNCEIAFQSAGDVTVEVLADGASTPCVIEASLETITNSIPFDLPLDLASERPTTLRKSLLRSGRGSEFAVKITSKRGKMAVKSVTAYAYIETMKH